MDTFTGSDIVAAVEAVAEPTTPEITPPSDQTVVPPAASARVSPVDPITPPPKRRGPMPIEEHEKVLANTRAKTREEVETEWKPYGWAKESGITREQYDATAQWKARAAQDPLGFVKAAGAEMLAHPELGPQIRSWAASILGQRLPAAPLQDDDKEPGPDLPTDTSNGVPVVYSATAQRVHDAWLERQMEARFMKKLEPELAEIRTSRDQRQLVEAQQSANTFAAREYQQAQAWPGFLEHKDAIAKVFAETPLTSDDPREVALAIRDAYAQVVYPTITQAARTQAVADVHKKVAAGSVNPGATTTTAPPVRDPHPGRITSDDVRAAFAKHGLA